MSDFYMLKKIKNSLFTNILKNYLPEILIFTFAFISRFFRLDYPKTYIFDEVYHAFTAEQILKWSPAAWEWWNPPPTGFAYEWTHPPLAKEFMVISMMIFGDNSFAWRFFSALFGFCSIVIIYLIARKLFNRTVAIFSGAVASLSGLLLVMSRIAMNDSYFLFFSLLAIYLFLNKRNFLAGISLGFSIASKWTGFFAMGIIFVLWIIQNYKNINIGSMLKNVLILIFIPFILYLASYIPFFLQKHTPPGTNFSNLQTFTELQQQMWWYHTTLKATHAYQSTPVQWVFDLRPVWLYVNYQGNQIANIYTLDNPFVSWFGILSILWLIYELFKKFSFPKFFVAFSYLSFFIFWVHSPRVMFNYHYLASTAILSIALGVILNELLKLKQGKSLFIVCLFLLVSSFIYFYPLWTGVHVPVDFSNHYFWLKSWK